MHHLSRVGSRLGEGLTSGLNKIASTTHEIASTTSNLAMQLMDPAVTAVSESPAALAAMSGPAVQATVSKETVDVKESHSEFRILSDSILRTIEEEIEEDSDHEDRY